MPDGVLTRIERVMETVRGRIAGRALPPGARLPSIRRMAADAGVSNATVVEAYERLVAEGAILARPGSGFYVAGQTRPLALTEIAPQRDRAIDPLWIARQSLEFGSGAFRPGCGWLPEDWMPEDAIRRTLRALARQPAGELVHYDLPLGHAPLRALIGGRLAERGIAARPEQVLLTDGGTHAIDLLLRLLIEPGDRVLIDDPCYFNFHALLRAHRARPVGVPYRADGPDLDAFARAVATERPRLYLTNAALHNPTGASLAPAVAHRLLGLAEAHDLVVVEDDIFGDFEPTPGVRLAALDGLKRVIHVTSFSKTLSAAARVGAIAARPDWIEALVDLKLAASFGNGALAARLVHGLLVDGAYRRHVEGLRTRLAAAASVTARRLKDLGLTIPLLPRGGMFLWARLPDGRDSAELARRALDRDVVLAPGNVFSLSGTAGGFLRFNVAQSQDPALFAILHALLEAT